MGNTLKGVHDGTSKVVSGICFVLPSVFVVWHVCLATVEHWVTQALVFVGHINLTTHAAFQTFLRSLQHCLPKSKVFLHRLISPAAGHSGVPLLPHLIYFCIIYVCSPLPDQLFHHLLQLIKVIRSVGYVIGNNPQGSQVFNDALFKLHFFFAWVSVIKTEDQLAFVVPSVMVVQQSRFGMADVKIAAGLRREARAHPPFFCVR
mmetsp:Transcript_36885/g.102383  ORF Transcript_36885/g.102383 Transcript_36885/m.102383 type:complete len:204 (-) Transcript_36885:385-996(-)